MNFRGARLDRALCTTDFLDFFLEVKIRHLRAVNSDHAPLLLNLGKRKGGGRRGFMFQAAWLCHHNFSDMVDRKWNQNEDTLYNTCKLASTLKQWNKLTFGNIHKRKSRILARLEGIQKCLGLGCTNGLIKLERKLRMDLKDTLMQEELLWFQQSREKWINSGDRNT